MADFHFIRPEWFFALIPLMWMLWQLNRQKHGNHGWQQIIPAHLVKHLMQGENATRHQPFWLLTAIWLIVVFALAGPAWEKLPQPVYQTNTGKVLIMDMSQSMEATDLTPNRLTKARFKAIDLIDKIDDADMGLIAYSGDAFVISPLTADSKNLVALIPSLSPNIMPLSGSNAYAAINLADELLKNAGYSRGEIYWITDGIETNELQELRELLGLNQHRVSILGVGTAEGAPIKRPNGELLKDNRGSIIIPKLNDSHLRALAEATGGAYSRITSTSIDIDTLAEQEIISREAKKDDEQLHQGDQFKEFGPILVMLILPFAAYAFRRGLVMAVLLSSTLIMSMPAPVQAAEQPLTTPTSSQPNSAEQQPPSWWKNLWQTKDQQAAQQFEQQNYADAAQMFENQQWRGSSLYKSGDYEGALKEFQKSDDASGLYNQGNAHAQMQNFDEAIKAYEKALEQQPDMEDAQKNLDLIKKLKDQQQQQQNQEQNQDGDNQEQNQDQQNQQNQDGQQGDQNQQDSQQNQHNEQGEQDQQSQSDQQQGEQGDESQPQPREGNEQQQGDQDPNAKQQQEPQEQSVPGEEREPQEGEQTGEQQLKPSDQQSTEEQEKMQEIQQLIRKINDDPAVLLRNKMQLEYQKRKYQNSTPPGAKSW